MKERLTKIIQNEKFHPTFLSFFINNNFLIRKNLRKAIKKNDKYLTGSLLDFGCGTKPYEKILTRVECL